MYTVDFISNSDANYLIEKLNKLFNVDYSCFSKPIFQRRVHNFLTSHNISDVEGIIEIVENDHRIFKLFVDEISLKETEMFRDAEFWQIIENDIFIKLLASKKRIKVWFPDSTVGAEFYTLAVILKETGYIKNTDILVSSFNDIILQNVISCKHNSKMAQTNNANYSRFKNYETDLSTFYKNVNEKIIIDSILQKNTQFSNINIAHDSLPEDIDLIIYRNKMLCFNIDLQEKIQKKLASCLNVNGFLAIGIKEQLNTYKGCLSLYNATERIYIKQK